MREQTPQHYFGLDLGTSTVRCVIGMLETDKDMPILSVIGYGSSPNTGRRKGSVVRIDEVVYAVVQAIT
jgi:cell division protein FtsA